MGNKLFKQNLEQQPDINTNKGDTISTDTIIEPTVVQEQKIATACEPEIVTVDIPTIDASDVAESLSKSLPIDIPVPEQTALVIKHAKENDSEENDSEENDSEENDSEENDSEENDSEENDSLSYISDYGTKSPPNTEESDIETDEDVLELEE